MASTKLHLKEIDWVLYFPSHGNEGRAFPRYGVAYRDRVRGTGQPGRKIDLEDVLSEPIIRDRYPHTAGLFREAQGKGRTYAPAYLETRVIHSEQELFDWLTQLAV